MDKHIVKIKQINWIDAENTEAEILFEMEGLQFWAFCHPCNFREGDTAEVYFSFLEEDIAESSFWNENAERKMEIISSNNNNWRYYCYGRLKSIHPVEIDCGSIVFSSGDWINDERCVGSYVYFVISRLDMTRLEN